MSSEDTQARLAAISYVDSGTPMALEVTVQVKPKRKGGRKLTDEEKAERKRLRDIESARVKAEKARQRVLDKEAARVQKIRDAEGKLMDLPCVVLRSGMVFSVKLEDVPGFLAPYMPKLCLDVEHSGYDFGHRNYELRTVQLGGKGLAVVLDGADEKQLKVASWALNKAEVLHAHSATADLIPSVMAGLIDWDAAWSKMVDSVLIAKLTDPRMSGSDANALKELAKDMLGAEATAPAAEKLKNELFRAMGCLTEVDITSPKERNGWYMVNKRAETMIRYAGSDVLDLAAVLERMPPLPVDQSVLERERKFQAVCARVAWKGFALDEAHIKAKIAEAEKHRDQTQLMVQLMTGGLITNPSSPDVGEKLIQIDPLLAAKLDLSEKTGKPSAARASLDRIKKGDPQYPLTSTILKYRGEVTKLGLLLRPLEALCDYGDSRMRPTVLTINADTGRCSCVRPNGQQFSRQGGIRQCVICDPGMLGISADFSGCEIRVAAALSGDKGLLEAETSAKCYLCGTFGDLFTGESCTCGANHTGLHWMAAHSAFGKEASYEHRYWCKRIIFSKLFGGSAKAGARQVGIDIEDSQVIHSAFEELAPVYAGWDKWLRQCFYDGSMVWRDYSTGTNFSMPIDGARRGIYRTYNGRNIYVNNGAHAFGNYCFTPDTPVLRADLKHVPARDIRPGDRLVAFDENPGTSRDAGNKYRYMRTAVVEKTGVVRKPSVKVTLSDGKSVTCSTDHQWLVRKAKAPHRGPRLDWGYAADLQPGDMLLSLGTWEADQSRTGGYLAGLIDGEGCLQSRGGGHKATGLTFNQLPGITMNAYLQGTEQLGLPGAYRKRSPGSTTPTDSVQVTGIRNIMRFLGILQPERFKPRFEEVWEGAAITAGLTETIKVVSVENVGVRELSFIQTSTRTLVANGYLSHNSIQGTARELLVEGVIKWSETEWGKYPLLPIHDEVLAWVPAEEAKAAAQKLRECMATRVLSVPGWDILIDAEADEPFAFWPDSS